MTPDNIHAYVLLLIPIFTAIVIKKFRRYANPQYNLSKRILFSLLSFIIFVILSVPFKYKMHPSPSPSLQSYLTVLCSMLAILCIPRAGIAFLAWSILMISGYSLCKNYDHLALHSADYTWLQRENDGPAQKKCSVYTTCSYKFLWHTYLTGIYRVVRVPIEAEQAVAIKKAQTSLPEFVKALNEQKVSNQAFLLKAKFGSKEYWVKDLTVIDSNDITLQGTLADDPSKPEVTIRNAVIPITDWVIVKDRNVKGAFLTRLLRSKMTKKEREEFDAKLPFNVKTINQDTE